MRKITPWEEVTISNGLMFRFLMERGDLCKKLLERILDIEIAHIEIPEFEKDFRADGDSKGIRLDVFLRDVNGVAINVEMQSLEMDKEAIGKRIRYYRSITDSALLPKGKDYTHLRQSYIIFICTFDPYEAGRARYTFSNLCHEDTAISMHDEATSIVLNAKGDRSGLTKRLANFLAFVNGEETEDSYVDELKANMAELKLSQEKRGMYMVYEQDMLRAAARAKEQSILGVVLNMLKEKVNLDFISRMTNLSADEVRRIAKDNGLSVV